MGHDGLPTSKAFARIMMASPGPAAQGHGARKSPENITQALGFLDPLP